MVDATDLKFVLFGGVGSIPILSITNKHMVDVREVIKYYFQYKKEILEELNENVRDYQFDLTPNFYFYASIFLGSVPFAYLFSNTFACAHFVIDSKMYIVLFPISKATLSYFFPFFGFFSSLFCLVSICMLMILKAEALDKFFIKHYKEQFTTEQKIAIFFICFINVSLILLGIIFFLSIMHEMYSYVRTGYRPILELMWYWNGLIDYEMYCYHWKKSHEYAQIFRLYKWSPLMADYYALSYEAGTFKPGEPIYKMSQITYDTIGTKHLDYLRMLKSLK